jgi:general secretion pathway protein E
MADPLDNRLARALEFALGREIQRRVALPADIETAYERLCGEGCSAIERISDAVGDREEEDRDADLDRLKDLASEAPVIRLINAAITRGVEMGTSDIHLESGKSRLRLRHRIDGVLREIESPPARFKSAIVSRLEIIAKLNIAEQRLAQDERVHDLYASVIDRNAPASIR